MEQSLEAASSASWVAGIWARLRQPAWSLSALGLLALAFAANSYLGVPVAREDAANWTSVEQKQKAADLLAASVVLPDFRPGVHLLEKGENFWTVARRAGVNIDTIVSLNPNLENIKARAKQPLLVANQRGAMHQIKGGETVATLATDYNVKADEIRHANRISWLGLRQGQLLFIPGAKPRQLKAGMASIFEKRRLFRSPLAGHYTSLVGSRSDPFTGAAKHHNGVDIKAPFNALVGAAADGKVILAGWNAGYGKCVRLDHGNGYETVYGHLNMINVKLGQKIKQHQIIGRVGQTGRATGPHLHFTIYEQGKVKNPLEFLW